MPWQQSEACQLWSLLSSGELCHIETSGDGGSHQDHIMTVCQITPTSLIMVWSQLRQYSVASAYLASMYCVLCTICTLYPDTIWDTITNLPSLYLDRWCALLHSTFIAWSFYGSPFIWLVIVPSEHLKDGWFLRLLVLKRKVWWPKKDEIEKKESWKIVAPKGNWISVSCMKCKRADHYTIQRLMQEEVD